MSIEKSATSPALASVPDSLATHRAAMSELRMETDPPPANGGGSRSESPNCEKHRAEELKEKGNHAFKEGHYQTAIDLYSEAIQLDSFNAALWSNRAFAYIKMEAYGYALIDASRAIELDEAFVKVCLVGDCLPIKSNLIMP